ncbi:hypothetical protein BDN70DRAFT_933532 [Pholiota conissans]|uniref:Flavin-containing monooxygenase n=1 Tax=Pholiota conissans TaxID=109636 RepID=A0A9P5YZT9_9AGAR|nr:hypothetical protein BDN70DRAFT_933532 [Pholiota conissans]
MACRLSTPDSRHQLPGILDIRARRCRKLYGNIERITEKGCVSSNGQEYLVNVLICAIGFDTSYKPRFSMIGHKGQNLAEVWRDEPKSYFGIAAHDFPNYFMFLGPNSPVGNGPVLIGMGAQADYILKMVDRWQTENVFSPKVAAISDFFIFKDEFMKRTITLQYLEAMAEPQYEYWDFEYVGNRFSFFGNGFSRTEADGTADLVYYVRKDDDAL